MKNRYALILFALLFGHTCLLAQTLEGGLLPYQSYHGGEIDQVHLSSGNAVIRIPLVSYPQRGGALKLNFSLLLNTSAQKIYVKTDPIDGLIFQQWRSGGAISPNIVEDNFISGSSAGTNPNNGNPYGYIVHSSNGGSHPVLKVSGTLYRSIDGTGFTYDTASNITTNSSGVSYGGSVYAKDSNGNQITSDGNNYTDTVGRVIPLPTKATTTTDFTGCVGPLPVTSAKVWAAPEFNVKLCYATPKIMFGPYEDYGTYPGEGTQALYVSQTVLQSVLLPNQTSWVFEYADADPGDPAGITHGFSKIILPTGGSISYTYFWGALNNTLTGPRRMIASRSVDANDGTGPHTWNYNYHILSTPYSVTVQDPSIEGQPRNETVHSFTNLAPLYTPVLYETQTKVYQGSSTGGGTLLRTTDTTYQYSTACCTNIGARVTDVLPTTINTTLDNGLVSKVTKTYDTGFTAFNESNSPSTFHYGLVTQETATNFGLGSNARITTKSYQALANSSYLTANLLKLLSASSVKDGSNNTLSNSLYYYDETGSPQGAHGNLTTLKQLTSGSNYLSTTHAYNTTGTVASTTDPKGATTTYTYNDPTGTHTYPTQVQYPSTNGVTHTEQTTWDTTRGLVTSKTDQNGQITSYDAYDNMWRLNHVTYPPGGGTASITYTDSVPNPQVTVTRSITGSVSITNIGVVDGLGRIKQSQLTTDPEGTTYVDTAYNEVGRKLSVSNPYRTNDTKYYTTFLYDALGRTTKQTNTDNTFVTSLYTGNCTTVTDEAGKQRKTCSDSLGRLTQVFEAPATLNYETDYVYDALGNLTCVEQHGGVTGTGCSSNPSNDATSKWRVRRFTYDSLSRLLTANNPESGLVQYGYDADSNVTSKTSPAQNGASGTVTINYCYDALNRLTAKDYASAACSSPAATYVYDSGTNGIGRRTSMTTDINNSASWAYDSMGRMTSETRKIQGITKTITANYNDDGSLLNMTYPSGHVVNYTPGGAGRPLSVYDSTRSYPFAAGASGSGNVTYWPSGALNTATLGGVVNLSNSYNERLQPITLQANGPGGTLMSRTYDFGVRSNDNGAVHGVTDNLDTLNLANRPIGSATFAYDALNRLTQAQSTGTDCSSVGSTTKNWGNTYTVDQWGNLTNKGAVTGLTGCVAESLNQSVGVNNRVSATDNAGNVTQNGALVYDKENRLSSAGGVTYVYDGDGGRVAKTGGVTRLYWTGVSDTIIAESDGSGNLTSEYVFFNGERIARIDNPTTTPVAHYYVADNLGSATVIANEAGALEREEMYYPYGGERWSQGSDPNRYKFTGKERDAESAGIVGADGLDYFGARYYSSTGRFLSPDWAARPTAMPYAVFGDPQSLNLYGYVRNDPLSRIDPDGHNQAAPELKKLMLCGSDPKCHVSDPDKDGNVTATVTTTTAPVTKTNDDGSTTVTTTTTVNTFTFNAAGNMTGAQSQTTTKSTTVTQSGAVHEQKTPGKAQELHYSDAVKQFGGRSLTSFQNSFLNPAGFWKTTGHDMHEHPFYYVGVVLGGAALPVAAIPGTVGVAGGAILGGGAIVSGAVDKTLY